MELITAVLSLKMQAPRPVLQNIIFLAIISTPVKIIIEYALRGVNKAKNVL